jgi:hypothetical protein
MRRQKYSVVTLARGNETTSTCRARRSIPSPKCWPSLTRLSWPALRAEAPAFDPRGCGGRAHSRQAGQRHRPDTCSGVRDSVRKRALGNSPSPNALIRNVASISISDPTLFPRSARLSSRWVQMKPRLSSAIVSPELAACAVAGSHPARNSVDSSSCEGFGS